MSAVMELGCLHREGEMCPECANEYHASHFEQPGFEDCGGCRIRSVQLSARVFKDANRKAPAPQGNNSWERGIATDHRGVPIRKADGGLIGVKEWAANRSRYEGLLRDERNRPAPETRT